MTNSQAALFSKYTELENSYHKTLWFLEGQYDKELITPGFYFYCKVDLERSLRKYFGRDVDSPRGYDFINSYFFKFDYFEDFFKSFLDSIPECSSFYIRNKTIEFEEYLKTIEVPKEPELEAVLKEVCTETCSIYDVVDPEKPFKI